MAEQIETSLELVGATAIEDKLQESGWQIETLKKLQLVAGGRKWSCFRGLFELDGLDRFRRLHSIGVLVFPSLSMERHE